MVADAREGEAEQSLSSRARDLLQGFSIGFSSGTMAEAGGGDSEDIELGLTLGGCFGSHRRENNGLVRFASIPAVLPRDLVTMEPLARTCSLPSETEEELMRRKELQILKRMEAKRKREERRSSKRTGDRFEGNLESWSVEKKRRSELENATSWMSANGSAKEVLYNSGLPNWITADSLPATPLKNFTPASQGSAVSQGSSFSGGSESESRPRQGFETAGISGGPEIRSPSRVPTITEQNHQKTSVPPSSATTSEKPISITALKDDVVGNANTQRKNDGGRVGHGTFELGKNMMEEMPSVFTRGDGPNGRKIEGFLYKYRRGEEVRIVCVCHGSFLTPAEFVKHAGGGDVAHPLRHIVVNPSPATFL